MITLIRLMILTYLKTKWQLAFWMEFNKQANEIVKHPENIQQKLLPFISETVHKAVELEKLKEK